MLAERQIMVQNHYRQYPKNVLNEDVKFSHNAVEVTMNVDGGKITITPTLNLDTGDVSFGVRMAPNMKYADCKTAMGAQAVQQYWLCVL
jgi:hypothetical protein